MWERIHLSYNWSSFWWQLHHHKPQLHIFLLFLQSIRITAICFGRFHDSRIKREENFRRLTSFRKGLCTHCSLSSTMPAKFGSDYEEIMETPQLAITESVVKVNKSRWLRFYLCYNVTEGIVIGNFAFANDNTEETTTADFTKIIYGNWAKIKKNLGFPIEPPCCVQNILISNIIISQIRNFTPFFHRIRFLQLPTLPIHKMLALLTFEWK